MCTSVWRGMSFSALHSCKKLATLQKMLLKRSLHAYRATRFGNNIQLAPRLKGKDTSQDLLLPGKGAPGLCMDRMCAAAFPVLACLVPQRFQSITHAKTHCMHLAGEAKCHKCWSLTTTRAGILCASRLEFQERSCIQGAAGYILPTLQSAMMSGESSQIFLIQGGNL